MPELPEVETVVRALRPTLVGARFDEVKILGASSVSGTPQPVDACLNKKIEGVERRAKYILIAFEGSCSMAIHLRMTGWLGVLQPFQMQTADEKFFRVLFRMQGRPERWFVFRDIRRFGRVWFGTQAQIANLPGLLKLGPEPLDLKRAEFSARLLERRGALKALLLNQTFIAGLGNIYCDEALFAARLHPQKQAQHITALESHRLFQAIRKTLTEAIAAGGSSIDDYYHPDGSKGWFQRELKVYGREGESCARCKAEIRRIVIGQRGTWFCPKCQRLS